jgi:gamma-glutamylcyclotransferase
MLLSIARLSHIYLQSQPCRGNAYAENHFFNRNSLDIRIVLGLRRELSPFSISTINRANQAVKMPPTEDVKPRTYYFAYGSNLRLKQMARRCPNSRYIGRARLSNYRWQINQRGFANVVWSKGYWVEGLVYELEGDDEDRLDKSEGVSKESYSKTYKSLMLHRAPRVLYRRPTSWIVKKGGPVNILLQAKQAGKSLEGHTEMLENNVLLYISLDYVTDGQPREEYINRLNLGIVDATTLGVDQAYIRNFIRPIIKDFPGATSVFTTTAPVVTKTKRSARTVEGRSSGKEFSDKGLRRRQNDGK